MIDTDVAIEWEGTKGTPTGTVKYIDNYGTPYEEGQTSGHFFPIKFEDRFFDQVIVVGSQNGEGGKEITPTEEDPYLVIRIENVTVANKISAIVQETQEEVFELDFSNVTLPSLAMMGHDETIEKYGSKLVSEIMNEDVKITWDGTTGKVTGTFPKVTTWEGLPDGASQEGHFFAMRIDPKYKGKKFTFIMDGKDPGTTAEQAGDDEMFWVLRIDKTKKFTFKSEDNIIAELDFSEATLQ